MLNVISVRLPNFVNTNEIMEEYEQAASHFLLIIIFKNLN